MISAFAELHGTNCFALEWEIKTYMSGGTEYNFLWWITLFWQKLTVRNAILIPTIRVFETDTLHNAHEPFNFNISENG